MESRWLIRSGIAASALAHLSVLAAVLIFAEVHPFGSLTAETIAVDIVSPDQVTEPPTQEEPLPTPKPSDAFDLSASSAAAPQQAAPSQTQAAPAAQQPVAAPQPSSAPMPTVRQEAAAQPQPSGIASPEPDLSVKYHVLLGLPPALPKGRPGDDFDAPASATAGVASDQVAEFRRHLKTCAKLPDSIAPSDPVKIKLRVFMTREAKLATEPVLIEASASLKGPALMQSAIGALQACQPYAMLPADKYDEWKVLDLSFTPQDFTGG